jgi:hypothetical protein
MGVVFTFGKSALDPNGAPTQGRMWPWLGGVGPSMTNIG